MPLRAYSAALRTTRKRAGDIIASIPGGATSRPH
jgi:hypothetical protein